MTTFVFDLVISSVYAAECLDWLSGIRCPYLLIPNIERVKGGVQTYLYTVGDYGLIRILRMKIFIDR